LSRAARPSAAPVKLSFGDRRRLAELEAKIADLPVQIERLEGALSDPGLYARDAEVFAALSRTLSAARAELTGAEDAWLLLAERRERLAGAGAAGSAEDN
ncbi:MAG: ABC transporter C-terminal domain-containing protein, partial [Caulobacteraceae bacterium]